MGTFRYRCRGYHTISTSPGIESGFYADEIQIYLCPFVVLSFFDVLQPVANRHISHNFKLDERCTKKYLSSKVLLSREVRELLTRWCTILTFVGSTQLVVGFGRNALVFALIQQKQQVP